MAISAKRMNDRRRVLITGASGWTGQHLSRLALTSGAQVFGAALRGEVVPGVTRCTFNLMQQSSVEALVAETRPDWVFHLAALVPDSDAEWPPERFIDINIEGTFFVLDALRRLAPSARVMVASSSAVYGMPTHPEQPITEDASFRPQSLYATTKVAQDMLAAQFFTQYGLHTLRCRTFNQTGPGEGPNLVCGSLARQIARIEAGLQEPVLRALTLKPGRDFSDVRDVAAGYWAALEYGAPGEVYNICSGRSKRIRMVAEILLGLSRVSGIEVVESHSEPGPGAILNQIGCASRLKSRSGWSPVFALEQSLSDLLDDWRTGMSASPHTNRLTQPLPD